MVIKTRGKQAFNVPNDPLGRVFLHLLKKYRNRGWYYRARGRGPREHHGNQNDIPQEHAEWLAVYLGHDRDWEYTPNVAPQEIHKPVFNRAPLVDPTYSFNWTGAGELGDRIETNPCASGRVGVGSLATGSLATLDVVEWSAPISIGDRVALTPFGKAYNAEARGADPLRPVGLAARDSRGSIGEGEAEVDVDLGTRNPVDHGELQNLPPEVEAAPPEEDTVELTPREQEILERVLEYMDNVELQHWEPGDRLIFRHLFEKLVD